jgi:glycosyltransferase involved in cell wall biosynthesis
MLATMVEMVERPDQADVVILHDEPHLYPSYYEQTPSLRNKYVIAYAVWEASKLPNAYICGISLIQEVWTCSHYCLNIFRRYHPNVVLVPHIAERESIYSSEDAAYISNLVQRESGAVYYLAIGRLWDTRKNMWGLIRSFVSTRKDLPQARLIVKTGDIYDHERLKAQDERIIPITEILSDQQINALYGVTDVFVSAHRSEGWGLCISDAMASGCLVIATNYSGPRDYLCEDNSILLPYKTVDVASNEEYGFFDRSMQWAEPNLDKLAEKFALTCGAPYAREFLQKRTVAKLINKKFSIEYVTGILDRQIRSLEEKVLQNQGVRRFFPR